MHIQQAHSHSFMYSVMKLMRKLKLSASILNIDIRDVNELDFFSLFSRSQDRNFSTSIETDATAEQQAYCERDNCHRSLSACYQSIPCCFMVAVARIPDTRT